jgi:hypothetical protein
MYDNQAISSGVSLFRAAGRVHADAACPFAPSEGRTAVDGDEPSSFTRCFCTMWLDADTIAGSGIDRYAAALAGDPSWKTVSALERLAFASGAESVADRAATMRAQLAAAFSHRDFVSRWLCRSPASTTLPAALGEFHERAQANFTEVAARLDERFHSFMSLPTRTQTYVDRYLTIRDASRSDDEARADAFALLVRQVTEYVRVEELDSKAADELVGIVALVDEAHRRWFAALTDTVLAELTDPPCWFLWCAADVTVVADPRVWSSWDIEAVYRFSHVVDWGEQGAILFLPPAFTQAHAKLATATRWPIRSFTNVPFTHIGPVAAEADRRSVVDAVGLAQELTASGGTGHQWTEPGRAFTAALDIAMHAA